MVRYSGDDIIEFSPVQGSLAHLADEYLRQRDLGIICINLNDGNLQYDHFSNIDGVNVVVLGPNAFTISRFVVHDVPTCSEYHPTNYCVCVILCSNTILCCLFSFFSDPPAGSKRGRPLKLCSLCGGNNDDLTINKDSVCEFTRKLKAERALAARGDALNGGASASAYFHGAPTTDQPPTRKVWFALNVLAHQSYTHLQRNAR